MKNVLYKNVLVVALFLGAISVPSNYSPLFAANTVKSKGMSFFEPGREAVAREKALDEAKRAAIEKAVGATVESRTAVENTEVIKDSIFSRSSGYLKNIEILEERKTDFGTYEVTIEAEVEISDMVSDLDRFQEALSWQKNPRVSVMIEPNTKNEYFSTANKAVAILSDKLKQAGFSVFRYQKSDETQMGLLIGVSIEHSAKMTRVHDYDVTLNEVGLSATIYRPVDGEILAASSTVRSAPGENRLQIIDQATRDCISDIWDDLTKKITETWERELYTERPITLVVYRVPNIDKATEAASTLKSEVTSVVDASMVVFNDERAEYLIQYRGWPDQFINEIQMSYFKKNFFDLNLQNIAGNRIETSWNGPFPEAVPQAEPLIENNEPTRIQ